MVVGVLGAVVVHPVALEYRQEHAQILHQHMEDLCVQDLRDKLAMIDIVQVMKLLYRWYLSLIHI